MRMPFGKWRGYDLSEIPLNYLQWLWGNTELRDGLLEAVCYEIQSRQDEIERRQYSSAMPTAKVDADKIQKIYRNMAFKWHPDRGGSHTAMQAINEFYEQLKQI
jgi:hypothetical protein